MHAPLSHANQAPGLVIPEAGGPQSDLLQRLRASLFSPVDVSFLVFIRIVFGAIMSWEVYRYFSHDWIRRYYIEPAIHFTYYGFSWIKPWPGRGMYVHFVVLGVLAVCILVGFCYRFATILFFLGFTYVFLLDQTRYLNHFYLVSLISFLLIFLPANRAFSVDALLRPRLRSNVVPAWTLWLLRVQIGIVYFYGGIAKLSSDWLRGEPMRMWLAPLGEIPGAGPIFKSEWFIYFFVIGGLSLDLFIVPLLLWKRTRLYAFFAAVAFHLSNALMFLIGIFPWFMMGVTLIFFPPDLLRRVGRSFVPPEPPAGPITSRDAKSENVTPIAAGRKGVALSRTQKAVMVVLTVYLGVQIFLPFRHFVYPGDVNWTEEGHRFSWHMKLRGKSGDALFTVTHPASGQTWIIDPRQYLGPRQLQKMVTQPEMILQFCHFLEREKRREGYENVEVRARVMASLNGRKPQLLIDPNVDLAREQLSILPSRWILPLTEPLPARGSASQTIQQQEN